MSTKPPLYNSQNINFLLHGKAKRALSFTAKQPNGLTFGADRISQQGAVKEETAHSVGRVPVQVPVTWRLELRACLHSIPSPLLCLMKKFKFITLQTNGSKTIIHRLFFRKKKNNAVSP